ncbi:MAG: hypothetical protein JXN65_01675 [Clostridia bacterium]|nr:hypothetical protein [Clostridia bacterium]
MKKFFTKDIYKQVMKKLSLTALFTLVISVMATIIMIGEQFSGFYGIGSFYYRYNGFTFIGQRGYTAAGIAPVLIFVMYIAPLLFSYLAFKYQNKRSLSDKQHSLPYTMTQQFVSRFLAVITILWAIIIITLITAWIALAAKSAIYQPSYLLLSALGYMAGSALIAAVMSAAMSFTGNLFANITVAGVLLFLPRTILFIIGQSFTGMIGNYVLLNNTNIFLNPASNIPVGILLDISMLWEYRGVSEILTSGSSIIYTLILAAFYFGLGLLLSKKRKSELAGSSFKGNTLKYIFASLIVTPIVAFMAYSLISEFGRSHSLAYIEFKPYIIILAFAIIIFTIVAFLFKIKPKSLLKGLLVFVCVSAISSGILVSGAAIAKAAYLRPVDADKVEYVMIDLSPEKTYRNTPVYTYGMLQAKGVKVYDTELIELLAENTRIQSGIINGTLPTAEYEEYGLFNPNLVWCEFHLKSGRKIVRNVMLNEGENSLNFTNLLLANDEYSEALLKTPDKDELQGYHAGYILNEEKQAIDIVVSTLLDEIKLADSEKRNVMPYYLDMYVSNIYNPYDSYGSVGSIYVYGQTKDGAYSNTFQINNLVPVSKQLFLKSSFIINKDAAQNVYKMILERNDSINYMNIQVWLWDNSTPDAPFSSLIYYSEPEERNTMDPEDMAAMLEAFSKTTADEFDTTDKYAIVNIQINTIDEYYDTDYLDAYIPLTDELYEALMLFAEESMMQPTLPNG